MIQARYPGGILIPYEDYTQNMPPLSPKEKTGLNAGFFFFMKAVASSDKLIHYDDKYTDRERRSEFSEEDTAR